MMNKTLIISAFAAFALLGGGAIAMNVTGGNVAVAQAQSAKAIVDAAIQRGEVGERVDGYLAVVDGKNPSAAVRAAVQEINIGRKSVYTQRANARNVKTEELSTLIGEQQIQKLPPGAYYLDASGVWKRK
ncbi:YdbL family protein [Litorimonas sp. RW-G-Af-16]|uniref:YdbL family protein n=1 Tax=Litorimonas sp. RW-G-Af-16 TaxID=3241168 RepID=UPI00390C7C09